MRSKIADLTPRPEDHSVEPRVDLQRWIGGQRLPQGAFAEILDPMRQIEHRAAQIDMPAALTAARDNPAHISAADREPLDIDALDPPGTRRKRQRQPTVEPGR